MQMVDATHGSFPHSEKGGEILAMLGGGPSGGGATHHGGSVRNPTSSFALSDFPALGNRSNAPNQQMGAMSDQYGNGGLHQQRDNYVMDKKDFPSLGSFAGKGAADGGAREAISSSDASSGSSSRQRGGDASADHTYGLLGLLSVIRNENPDRSSLALGKDLTSLGLNLNSSTSLYDKFTSPWAENSDGAFQSIPSSLNIPACYLQAPSCVKPEHFSHFTRETLFYVFYSMPRDTLQMCAAVELYQRGWHYHQEMKIWFSAEKSAGPQKRYVYFDCNAWEARAFNGNIPGGLEAGFLRREHLPGATLGGATK